jgi:hypothetical protein
MIDLFFAKNFHAKRRKSDLLMQKNAQKVNMKKKLNIFRDPYYIKKTSVTLLKHVENARCKSYTNSCLLFHNLPNLL